MRRTSRDSRGVLPHLSARARYTTLAAIFCALSPCFPQSLSLELGRAREMLHVIKDDIGKNYYDPGYHGANLNARVGAAEEQIKQATSQGQAFGVIAQALM